ncbi:hypothetical protein DBR40_21475 [Pedobacter sp. KBW01]|uniref:hypothetical protein n=1 Tax=Pedobacter sp. KBW01 TaxID=2153364 RepID=UPI000F5A259F|nr:hypothetical protein [Pedobacter sp. KBW01]RQO66826.1 hypothetical protein DBR40_21475 [Pedobacter sp. KBW01]
MNYLQWNNLIGDLLFCEDAQGKMVSLLVSKDELIQAARKGFNTGDEVTGEDILEDFKQAWRQGYPSKSPIRGLVEKINYEYRHGDDFHKRGQSFFGKVNDIQYPVHYPPALVHLVGVLMAVLDRNEQGRYKRVCLFFGIPANFFPSMNEGMNWNKAWDGLVWWANVYKAGSLGLLPDKSLSSQKFQYMGKPYTHLLLSRKQVLDFYRYLFLMDQEPNAEVLDSVLFECFLKVAKRKEFLDIVSSPSWSEDKGIIFSILKAYYQQWQGDVELEEDGEQRFYQSRRLRLCFSVGRDGYAEFSFRFRDSLFGDAGLRINGADVEIFPNQWSSALKCKSFSRQQYRDNQVGLKVVFSPVEERVFVFCKGDKEGLDPSVLLEAQHIQPLGRQYLLARKDTVEELFAWIYSSGGVLISEDILDDGMIGDWEMFRFNNGFSGASDSGIAKLCFPAHQSLSYVGGLNANKGGEFIAGYEIGVIMDGAAGEEKLVLHGSNGNFTLAISEDQRFLIPAGIPGGSYMLGLVPDSPHVHLPNGGILKIVPLEDGVRAEYHAGVLEMPLVQCSEEEGNFKVANNLLKNPGFVFSTPPQFGYWHANELLPGGIDARSGAAIRLLEYISYISRLDTGSFDLAVYRIFAEPAALKWNKSFGSYTLNALKESLRVNIQYDPKGRAKTLEAIPPFLVRLGNFQNFPIPSWNAMRAFEGCLYSLCGCYSLSLLKQISGICLQYGAELRIFRESSDTSLLPPSVYLYERKGNQATLAVLALLGQADCKPNYTYMAGLPTFGEWLDMLLNQPDFNLHVTSRYKIFDLSRAGFNPAVDTALQYPSLAQYQVEPWKWHYVIRLETDGVHYNRETGPRTGKYFLLQAAGTDVLVYNKAVNAFFVPAYYRLPEEIERNLFLHTGRLPETRRLPKPGTEAGEGGQPVPYLVYSGVLMKAAEKIARSLGQNLTILEQ